MSFLVKPQVSQLLDFPPTSVIISVLASFFKADLTWFKVVFTAVRLISLE